MNPEVRKGVPSLTYRENYTQNKWQFIKLTDYSSSPVSHQPRQNFLPHLSQFVSLRLQAMCQSC